MDQTTLFSALHQNDIPENLVEILRASCSNTSGSMMAYGWLSISFETTDDVLGRWPISSFLSNFVVTRQDALGGLQDADVELVNGEKLHNLGGFDDVVCSNESVERAIGRLSRALGSPDMSFPF